MGVPRVSSKKIVRKTARGPLYDHIHLSNSGKATPGEVLQSSSPLRKSRVPQKRLLKGIHAAEEKLRKRARVKGLGRDEEVKSWPPRRGESLVLKSAEEF